MRTNLDLDTFDPDEITDSDLIGYLRDVVDDPPQAMGDFGEARAA